MFILDFNQNIQPEIEAEIRNHFDRWSWIIPGWIQRIYVKVWSQSEEEGTMLTIKGHYDYREACIDVMCGWLNQDQQSKSLQMLHELLHLHLGLIADFARDNFDRLADPSEAPKYNKTLQDELRVRHESATQDLAYAIQSWAVAHRTPPILEDTRDWIKECQTRS